ncbi:MAG: hypothetical protein ABIP57_09620 [Jatrophihabitantaceae bacterium]
MTSNAKPVILCTHSADHIEGHEAGTFASRYVSAGSMTVLSSTVSEDYAFGFRTAEQGRSPSWMPDHIACGQVCDHSGYINLTGCSKCTAGAAPAAEQVRPDKCLHCVGDDGTAYLVIAEGRVYHEYCGQSYSVDPAVETLVW